MQVCGGFSVFATCRICAINYYLIIYLLWFCYCTVTLTHCLTFSIFSGLLTALKKWNFTNNSKIMLRELCASPVLWLIAGCVDSWRCHQWRTHPGFTLCLQPHLQSGNASQFIWIDPGLSPTWRPTTTKSLRAITQTLNRFANADA